MSTKKQHDWNESMSENGTVSPPNYEVALDKMRVALDLSAVTLVSYGDGVIDGKGLVMELLDFRLAIFKALESVNK